MVHASQMQVSTVSFTILTGNLCPLHKFQALEGPVGVQSLSWVQVFETQWTVVRQAFLSFNISQSLLKLMPSNHLILCRPLLLLPSFFPNIRVFSKELALLIWWPKYWSFSFSISPSKGYSGLISFRIDWSDLLAVKGLSRVFSSTTV